VSRGLEAGIIRVPVHVGEKIFKVERAAARHLAVTGSMPTLSELCAATGLSAAQIQNALHHARASHSLDAPRSDDPADERTPGLPPHWPSGTKPRGRPLRPATP
jgi:DNA-directed RNA polymerase sigma subunit (sigma70/sigma32)